MVLKMTVSRRYLAQMPVFPLFVVTVLLFCLFFSVMAGAQEEAEKEELLFFSGEDLFVVSASRFSELSKEAPAIIEVISAGKIKRSGARTIAELLRW